MLFSSDFILEGQNINVLLNSDNVNFLIKTNVEEIKSLTFLV